SLERHTGECRGTIPRGQNCLPAEVPLRAMRERNLAPPVGGAFSCRTLGTLGDGLTWRYAQTLFIRFSLAPASRRGFSCARHAAGRPLLFPFYGGRLCGPSRRWRSSQDNSRLLLVRLCADGDDPCLRAYVKATAQTNAQAALPSMSR